MKYQKLIIRITLFIFIIGIVWGLNLRVLAEQKYILPTPRQGVIGYLKAQLKRHNIPFIKIEIIQDSPLQVEIDIQSLSEGKDWMPEDSKNLYLARREAVLAAEKGFNIERYTEVLLNKNGETISWARIKINGEISYTKLVPSNIPDSVALNLASKKINPRGMSIINKNVSSFDGFQNLNLDLLTPSMNEANQSLSQIRDSLHPLASDINAQGAQIAMINMMVKDEKGDILLNYLLDLQFGVETWWAADGIDVTNWYPSIPATAP